MVVVREGFCPPYIKAEVDVPLDPESLVAAGKSLTSVQLEPFHNSVAAVVGGADPPIANAAVLLAPADIKLFLAVPKSATSVQLVPFQDSVFATIPGAFPPIAKADVAVPVPVPNLYWKV